jgi:hypothetical protein
LQTGLYQSHLFMRTGKQYLTKKFPGNKRDAVIFDVFNLAAFISGSELWNAQIAQIYVNNKYELELIPRVGAHVIYLGSAGIMKQNSESLRHYIYMASTIRDGTIMR